METKAVTSPQQALIDEVRAWFGDRAVVTDTRDIEPWLTDWRGRWHGKSAAILQPQSTEETSLMVAKAADLGVAIVPQGGNTSMVGGATPPVDGSALILSLRRMNRIRLIDRTSSRVVAEAGVILQALHDAVAEEQLRFPLTLGAKGSATIGGLIFSGQLLLDLAEAGMLREDAYRLVQSHAMRSWKEDLVFRDEVAKDPEITKMLTPEKLAQTFDYTRQLGNVDAIFKRVLGE